MTEKYIFIGSFYPEQHEPYLFSGVRQNAIDFAANNFQHGLIRGFSEILDDLSLLTSPALRTYPRYFARPFSKGSRFDFPGTRGNYRAPVLHLPLFNLLFKLVVVFAYCCKLCRGRQACQLIIYAAHTPYLLAAALLKTIFSPRLRICLVVPDLPQFMRRDSGFFSKVKQIDYWVQAGLYRRVDRFVLLNARMREFLPAHFENSIVVEGIHSGVRLAGGPAPKERSSRIIMYAGNLSLDTGVKSLIEAFLSVAQPNWRLCLAGKGTLRDYCLALAQTNPQVSYYDYLPQDALNALFQQADVLVNPVPLAADFAQYFFPSKLVEYMASGTPVLTSRLPAIPSEYEEYLFFLETDSTERLAASLADFFDINEDQRVSKGRRAQEFILREKSPQAQARRIVALCSREL